MKFSVIFLFAGMAVYAQEANGISFVANSGTTSEQAPPPSRIKMVNGVPQESKREQKVIKPITHNNNHALFMSVIGGMYAFLAEPKTADKSYLSAISLPLMKAAFESEGRPGVFEKVEFHTLVKIELLENINGKPGNKIEGLDQTAIVSNAGGGKKKTFDIKLNKEIALPENGAFVQLTITGRCDAAGVLNHDKDFIVYKDANDGDKEKKWMEWCQPNFPLKENPKGTLTFYKNPNYGNEWRTIDQPHLHEIKNYPDFNIGFGYTLVTY